MIGNLTIVSGNIRTSSSSSYSSGIGTGLGESGGTSKIENLTIVSGNITANSSYMGSGIGTGLGESDGTSKIENLMIVSGNITASSSNRGSGIGTGIGESGTSVIETLSVLGGKIRVNGTQSGIGSGFEESEVQLLRFSGTVILFCTVTDTNKFPINASSIVLSDTLLTITTPQNRVFGGTPIRQSSLNLSIVYENVTSADSEPLWLLNSTFLQIGNVSLPNSDFWNFCISGIDPKYCIHIESRKVKSLLFSVPSQGSYSIRASNEVLIGFIEADSGLSSFNVWSNFSFIPEGYFVVGSSPAATITETRSQPFTVPLREGYRTGKIWILKFAMFVFLVED
jgi:hypothetical protein